MKLKIRNLDPQLTKLDELRSYKHKHKLTIDALARDMDVPTITVARWLSGAHRPSKLAFAAITLYLRSKHALR